MGAPLIRISPAVGTSKPATIRRVVVLPEPEAPSRVRNSPDSTLRDRSSTATKSPNLFVTWRSSRRGGETTSLYLAAFTSFQISWYFSRRGLHCQKLTL